ncbi:MADCAM1 isoform 1 [Pongo abelii]|uniref:MADCAM1 isoform 1 n=1 Tax=Pongo abelii TaxID=9601 RepID=A0A2J8R0Q6_PONAB|nr:MADCAM1 isoform 1 [Pongo abelii]
MDGNKVGGQARKAPWEAPGEQLERGRGAAGRSGRLYLSGFPAASGQRGLSMDCGLALLLAGLLGLLLGQSLQVKPLQVEPPEPVVAVALGASRQLTCRLTCADRGAAVQWRGLDTSLGAVQSDTGRSVLTVRNASLSAAGTRVCVGSCGGRTFQHTVRLLVYAFPDQLTVSPEALVPGDPEVASTARPSPSCTAQLPRGLPTRPPRSLPTPPPRSLPTPPPRSLPTPPPRSLLRPPPRSLPTPASPEPPDATSPEPPDATSPEPPNATSPEPPNTTSPEPVPQQGSTHTPKSPGSTRTRRPEISQAGPTQGELIPTSSSKPAGDQLPAALWTSSAVLGLLLLALPTYHLWKRCRHLAEDGTHPPASLRFLPQVSAWAGLRGTG